MEKLREAVIKLASSNQKKPLSSSQIALIDQRLHDSFPHGLRLPSHPTYASMIIKAITELSEERGSSEDSISEHMKANCDDLPWAHKSMLSYHLNRLCDEGLIILIDSDRYTIPGFTQKTVLKKGKLKGKHVGMMKQKIRCQEDLNEYREHPHGSASNERKLRSGRRRLVLQENEEELVGLDSCRGMRDEHVGSGCEERVVVAGKEDDKGQEMVVVEGKEEDKGQEVVVVQGKEEDNQEAQESEVFGKGGEVEKQKRLSPKQSISEMVKIHRRKTERKCDQLVPVGIEEKSSVDKCQDKTRNESLALEDNNGGGILMNNGASFETPVKVKICCSKRERKCDQLLSGGSDGKSLVDECQDKTRSETLALEDDNNGGDLMNNDTSFETPLKKRKKDAEEVKIRRSNRERKCDQLVTVGTEEKSVGDECQDKTRNEMLALKDDNSGCDLMNNGMSFKTPLKKKEETEKVKIRHSNRERKCDQLVNVGTEEQSVGDECQGKTRNETLALEDDNNGGDLMNNGTSVETPLKKKEDAEKVMIRCSNRERKCDQLATVGTEEKYVGDECQDKIRNETLALEDDKNGGDLMSNGTSVETPLKKMKKDAEKVKMRRSNRGRKYDQLVTIGTEEKSVGDECQDKTRKETLALEDDNIGGDFMDNGTSFETPLKKRKDAEKVKNRSSKRGRKCDQLPTGGDEEKYLVDECLDKTRNEILAFGGDSNDSGVMNNGASLETAVKKKKKKVAETCTGLVVCGIATKLPKLMEERRVTRQISKSKEQPNKLIISPVNSFPSSKLQEHDNQQEASKLPKPMEPEPRFTRRSSKSKEQPNKLIISPVNPLPSSKRQERGNQQEASNSSKPLEPERRVTRKSSVSKEQPNKLIISPVNPLPSSKLQEHDDQPEASKSPRPVQRVTRKVSVPKEQPNKLIISPVTPLPSSKLQEHDNQPEASIQSSQEAKNNWPSWVQSLLQTTFFCKCKVHANVEKSLCNFCCLDCKNGALCSSCLTSHEDHRVIKIKRAVSEDAVDISNIEMNVDISGIHTHKLNADTLIVLNRMIPSGHSFAGNVAPCLFCKRPIPNLFDFCSLNCKYEQRMAGSAPCKIK